MFKYDNNGIDGNSTTVTIFFFSSYLGPDQPEEAPWSFVNHEPIQTHHGAMGYIYIKKEITLQAQVQPVLT